MDERWQDVKYEDRDLMSKVGVKYSTLRYLKYLVEMEC